MRISLAGGDERSNVEEPTLFANHLGTASVPAIKEDLTDRSRFPIRHLFLFGHRQLRQFGGRNRLLQISLREDSIGVQARKGIGQ